jgi:hypothetical protein
MANPTDTAPSDWLKRNAPVVQKNLEANAPTQGDNEQGQSDWLKRNAPVVKQNLDAQMHPATQKPAEAAPATNPDVERQKAEKTWEGYSPAAVQTVAGLGSAADTATLGLSPWAVAAGQKGLGKIGVKGYEKEATMPLTEIKQRIEKSQEAANTLYPKTSMAGTGAGIVGGALLLPVLGAEEGAGLAVRAGYGALTGAGYGAVSGAAEKGDPMDALRGALVGGASGGILTPVGEKVFGGLSKLFPSSKSLLDEQGNLVPKAVNYAKSQGMSDTDIAGIQDKLAASLKKYGMTPAAVEHAKFSEFGIEPTAGMATKDPEQLAREAQFGQESHERVQQQATQAAQNLTGGPRAGLRDAVATAVNSAETQASDLKDLVNSAYEKSRNVRGYFEPEKIQDIGTSIFNKWAQDPNVPQAYRSSEVAQQAAKGLNEELGKAYAPLGAKGEMYTLDTSFGAIDNARKQLNNYYGKSQNNTDRAAIRQLIEDFDGHVEDLINNGAFSGDPDVLKHWQNARKLYSEYQSKFGVQKTGEDAGSLLKTIISNNTSDDDVARMLFNFGNSGDASMKATAMKTYNQLGRALGPNSPELENVRQSFLQQLMTPTDASPKAFGKIADRIDAFTKGSAAGVAKTMFSDQERAALARFSNIMRSAGSSAPQQLQKEVGALRSMFGLAAPSIMTGAAASFGMVHPFLASLLSAAGTAVQAKKALNNLPYKQVKLANMPLKPSNPPPNVIRRAVPLAATTAYEGRADGGRIGRKSGGRAVGAAKAKADKLISMVDRIKKDEGKGTEPLLNVDDTTIAKALEIAKRGI